MAVVHSSMNRDLLSSGRSNDKIPTLVRLEKKLRRAGRAVAECLEAAASGNLQIMKPA
jgi:hypothetical protein